MKPRRVPDLIRHLPRPIHCLMTALGGVFCLVLALWLTSPQLDAYVTVRPGYQAHVTLPWSFRGAPNMREIHVNVRNHPGIGTAWRIVPDDRLVSLTVNGRQVPLSSIPANRLSDWQNGFRIDLHPWLQPGHNDIGLQIQNTGGPGGVYLRPEIEGWPMLVFFAGFMLLLYSLHQWMPLTREQLCIITLALIVLLTYWSMTPWQVRTHDVGLDGGHLGYATWVAQNLTLPNPNAGWTFFHPPLYYIVAAAILSGAKLLGISGPESLQIFALTLWLVFLVASASMLSMCLRGHRYWLMIATFALCLWPSGIIHSIRIGNDPPTYACCALAGLYMMRWWKNRSTSARTNMAVWSALSLACKTSAVGLVATGAALLAWRILAPGREGRWRAALHLAGFTLVIACGLAAGLGNNIYHYLHGGLHYWLVSNIDGLSSGLRVPNTLKSFIPLDLPTFLTTPWADPWNDSNGRTNFWNYLLRNGLTGEFSFDGPAQNLIAYLWGIALLPVCLGIGSETLNILRSWHHSTVAYRLRPILLLGGFWLASLIALRIKAPFACSNDFRHILPILLPAVILGVRSGRLARGALLVIGLLSAYFYAALP